MKRKAPVELTDDQIMEIRTRHQNGEKIKNLAPEFGIHPTSYYSRIKRRGLPHTKPSRTHFMEIPIEKNDNVQDHTNNNETKVAVIVTTTSGLKQVLEGLWK